jgi:hypothetical protein
MLQKIRDKTQGWFATLILGAVCVTFALFGAHYYLEGSGNSEQYVAKVNGKTISQQQFKQTLQQVQQQQEQTLGADYSDSPSFQRALKAQVLQQMIEQTLLTNDLAKHGFVVVRDQIDALIVGMPAFQENGVFSQARFNQIMQQMMFSEAQFYQQLQDQLLVGQLAMGINNSNYALPVDLKAAVMLLNETRDLGFMVLPLSQFVNQVNVTEDQIQAYYQQHQKDFKNPEQVQVQYILLPANTDNKQSQHFAEVSDQLANLTYENPNSLTVAAQKLNLKLMTTDYFSRQSHESTGILASPKVIEAAFSDDVLSQGYNSDVITLDDGSQVVIRLAGRKPSTIMPLAQVHDTIKNILIKQAAQQAMKQVGDKLATQLATGVNGETLAKQQQVGWHEKTDVNRHQQNVNPQVLQTAFNMYVPADRQHPTTQTIMLPSGNLAVVAFYQVKYGDVKAASPAKLRIFSNQIKADYGRVDYALYVRSLTKNASIKLNQSFINNGANP